MELVFTYLLKDFWESNIENQQGINPADFLSSDFDLSRTMFAQYPHIVLSTFSKVAPRGVSALGVSFWELFLCAYCAKEKVDKILVLAIVCGTIYR